MPQVPAENASTAQVAGSRHGAATAWWGKLHGMGPVIGLSLIHI